MNWFRRKVLGVDIGSRTVKGVRLRQERDGRVELDGHFFQDLSITSDDFPVRTNRDEALKAALEVQRLSSSMASAALRDSEIMTFNLEFPKMKEKELEKVILQEVAEVGGFAAEEHTCDFIVGPSPVDNPEVMSVRAFAVKKDLVLDQMKSLKKAGLKAQAIESEMMALTAMLEFNGYIDPKEVAVVIDLGESHVSSGLIVDGSLSVTREHGVSFGAVNKALQDQMSISYEQAEKLKAGYDFLAGAEEGAAGHILDEMLTSIIRANKDAIDYYRELPESYGRVDRILLVGGASQMKGLDKVHQMLFKIPTIVVNPFRNIDVFTSLDEAEQEEITRIGPYMATAVGLALATIPKAGKV
jgi:type IV pilus assembly protein PilM